MSTNRRAEAPKPEPPANRKLNVFSALRIEARMALAYAFFGGLWILFSDTLLNKLVPDQEISVRIQTYKGWVFVALSAALIFLLLQRELKLRNDAEQKLDESQRRFHTAFDDLLEGVQIIDRDWRYVYVNDAVVRQGRVTRADLIGHKMMDAYPGIEQTGMFTALRVCMNERISTQMENEFVYPDGSTGWFNLSMQPVMEGALILSFDITERKRAEEQLTKSEQRHRVISELISDYVYILRLEPDGKFVLEWVSGSFERVSGYSVAEVDALGGPVALSSPDDVSTFRADFERLLQGESVVSEMRVISKGGETRWVQSYLRPVWDETQTRVIKIVGAGQDITERKQAEESLNERLAELELIYLSGLALSGELDQKQIARKLMDALEKKMAWHHIAIRKYDSESDRLELLAFKQPNLEGETQWHAQEERFNSLIPNASQGMSGWAVRHGKTVRSGNVHEDERYIETYPGIHSGLYVPILLGERVAGVISVESKEWNAFSASDERLLKTIANQAAVAFENARLFQDLQRELTERKQAEEKLRESEKQYRFLLDNTSDFIARFDRNGMVVFGTDASLRFNGYRPNELINTLAFERIHPEDQDKVRTELQRVIETNAEGRVEYRLRRKDGAVIWVEASGRRVFNADGEPEAIVVQRDITERKRTEEELRESETRYRYLFETNPQSMWIYDLKSLAFLAVNDAAIAKYGYTREEFLTMTIADIRPAEELPRLMENLAAPRNALEYSEGWRHRLKDGRLIDVAVSSHILNLDQRDAVLVVAQDITERKQAEEHVAYQAFLLENVSDAILATDERRHITGWNHAAEKMIGWAREEALGRPVHEIVRTEISEEQRDMIFKELTEKGHYQIEVRVTRKDGEQIWVEGLNSVLRAQDGKAIGYISINRDITERKQAEKQLAALQEFTHATLNALSANICVIDETGKIVLVNQAWESFARSNNADPSRVSEGANYFTVCEGIVGVERQSAAEFAAGIRLVLGGKCAEFSMEYACHSEDERRWFIARVTRFQTGDSNQAVIAHINISGRKLAEEALHISEERFSTIFHSSPNPIAITRLADAKLIDMNDAWQTMTGYAWEEAIGRSPIDLDLWVNPSERARLTQKVADRELVRAFEMQLRPKTGNVRTLLMSAEIVTLQGEMCILTTAQDITELKQAEQAVHLYTRQLQTAGEMGRMIAAQLDVEKIYESLGQAVMRLLPDVDSVFVSRFALEEQTVTPVYGLQDHERVDVSKLPPLPLPPDSQGLQSDVIRTGEAIIVENAQKKRTGRLNLRAEAEHREMQSAAYVPLAAQDRILGVLQVQSYTPDRFRQTDIELLTLVGNTAAVAMQNAELFAETRQRVRELETVNHISVALRASPNREQALAVMLEETLNVFNTRHGAISLWDEETETLREEVTRGWLAAITERPIRSGEGIFGTVFASGETHISDDFASDPLTLPRTRSILPLGWGGACVPIRANEKILGVLTVAVPHQRVLHREDVRLLETLAEMAGTALNRMSLNEEVRQHLERLQSLREIDIAITGSFDRNSTLETILMQVISQLGVSAADILMLDPVTQTLGLAAHKGFSEPLSNSTPLGMGESFAGTALAERHMVSADLQAVRGTPSFYKLWQREGFASYHAVPLIVKDHPIGILETYQRTVFTPNNEWFNFLDMLAGQAAIALENAGLFENLENANLELMQAYDSTIEGWSHAMDLRDRETEGHTLRVTDLTLRLALAMGASSAETIHIRRGALLHDIGKMGVPDRILLKPDKLNDGEWEIMRKHPIFALEMLQPIHYLKPALNIPYSHHEKWDGTGYPRGLAGEQIPLEARIFAVVDVWDALTSDRPYRPAWSKEKALDYIKEQSGKHFDPDVVFIFLRLSDEERGIRLQSGA